MDTTNIKRTLDIAKSMAAMGDYFGEDRNEQILWIRAVKSATEDLKIVLQEGEYTLLDLDPTIVACNLCLKTYSAEDGQLTEAESLILGQHDSCSPWPTNLVDMNL